MCNDTPKTPPPLSGKGEATFGIIHVSHLGFGMEEGTIELMENGEGGGCDSNICESSKTVLAHSQCVKMMNHYKICIRSKYARGGDEQIYLDCV